MHDDAISGEPFELDADLQPTLANVLVVACGGAVGTVARFSVSDVIAPARDLPVGVLIVNVTGAALLGLLIGWLGTRPISSSTHRARLFLGTGILGGYTTYSLVALATTDLFGAGRLGWGIGYALATVVGGVAAAWLGVIAGRGVGPAATNADGAR